MEPKVTQLFAQIAVATALLSAVADRFGLWGQPNSKYIGKHG